MMYLHCSAALVLQKLSACAGKLRRMPVRLPDCALPISSQCLTGAVSMLHSELR